jgi:chromosomal replication initiator protein
MAILVMDNTQLASLWKQCLGELQVDVTPATFRTMIAQIKLDGVEKGVVRLSCRDTFMQQQVESRYYTLIKNVLEKRLNDRISLVFEVRNVDDKSLPIVNDLPLFAESDKKSKPAVSELTLRKARLVDYFTFDTFAVGSTNQMAYAAAEAVSKNPGKAYNPLFIWGGVGVGKTHLMQAIGQTLLVKDSQLNMLCCPGEEFTNEIVEAIRTKTTMAFKERYRKVDLLMLDDVQFLAGKDTAQEEFFHTFNAIQRAGGQIVLTSDRPPSEMIKLEDRLRSRFEAGLIVDIDNPDFELRTAIILIKAGQQGMEIDMEVAQLIAQYIESAREMEGFLKQLQLHVMRGGQIDYQSVQELLGAAQAEVRLRKGVRPADIVRIISDVFGVKTSQIKGKRRQARIVLSRQIAMFLMRQELNLQFEAIGEIFSKDHTTVMHSVEKIEALMLKTPELREQISGIKNQLR